MEGKRRRFKKLGGDKMKKEYLIIATITLAVLILASSVPAMQSTSISEYQPICPEESYSKITELYDEGLSEDEIAEELAFPLDIVTRYLEGNYTPPPYPVSNQSISPSDCPTYSKIKDLYGEGWSEEEIAKTLELPIDVVSGFLSGNYTLISACPEPYQSPTYDRLQGAKENDNQNITKLRQEIETQMKEYAWADKIAHDIMIGKYDRPPGAKEYKPREGDRPTPPLPPRPDLLPYFKDSSTNIPKDSAEKYGVAAGYQVFGGDDKPVYCGRVYGQTNSIPDLKDYAMEWHVIHQWGRTSGGNGTENCVVITRNTSIIDDNATFGIVVSSLGGSHGGYQDWVHYPANHEFYIGQIPQHDNGNREYDRLYFWVWDLTANEWWSHTYTLPETELIDSVDAALEHNITVSPNGLWKNFYQFRAYDQNIGIVDYRRQ
jgi:predicted transcriptional regulator